MPEKLEMRTKNLVTENIEWVAEKFPNCITEVLKDGVPTKAVDFDALKQELSDCIVDDSKERYQFTWPDKSKAKLLANSPINMTLRPCPEESVDFENTKNLYIEGDNLDVLKLLRETYLGKIKMIYIDPPYNTGNDFVYNDSFAMSSEEFITLEGGGEYDENGNMLRLNSKSNGRFHTNWLNMMYPRIILSKNLLSDSGVIFASVDDNELLNVLKLFEEVFGTNNHIATFTVASNSSKNNSKYVSVTHEYLICFAKNKNALSETWYVKKNNVDEFVKRANQLIKRGLSYEEIHDELMELVKYPRFYDFDHYTYVDSHGIYETDNPGGVPNGNHVSEIIHPRTGKPCNKPIGGWRYNDDEMRRKLQNDEFCFGLDETTIPRVKRYLSDYLTQIPKSTLFFDSQSTTKWLKKEKLPFDFPKSVDYISYIISMIPDCDLIMDFFSGSATTAHATMNVNLSDHGKRRYILVQLPEECAPGTEARKNGYNNICEIGKERIRRVGKNIKKDNSQKTIDETAYDIDLGFRVLKLDSSNMKDVYYSPDKTTWNDLDSMVDNVKEDRTPQDLLFQTMLDLGIDLSSSIERAELDDGGQLFNVDNGYLLAYFDSKISESTVIEIAKKQPVFAVFRDSSMDSDSTATNFEQIFKTYSPNTTTKVI